MFVTRPVNFVLTGYFASTPSHGSASSCFMPSEIRCVLGVEADDLDVDRLPDLQGVGWMVDAPPRDVGDVQQSVDSAQIDEGAVVGDVLDHAFEHLSLVQVGD